MTAALLVDANVGGVNAMGGKFEFARAGEWALRLTRPKAYVLVEPVPSKHTCKIVRPELRELDRVRVAKQLSSGDLGRS